jgi:hypothetical protein
MPLRLDQGHRLDMSLRLDAADPVLTSTINQRRKHHMQNLQDYFVIAFADPNTAFTRLLTFGARSLGRLSKSNPGNIFDTIIAATTTALSNAESGVTDLGAKAAIKLAKTEVKDNFREALSPIIRRIYGSLAGVYGDPAPELTECFPQGRTVFHTCKDEELNNKLGQLVACLANKTVDAGIKTLAQAQLTNWNAIYTAQGEAKDDVEVTADSQDAKRAALALQLYKNVLTVALQFPGDFAKCDYYFPQQYLRRPSAPATPDKAVLTADPFDSATRKATLHGSANGAEFIRFERRMQGENDWSEIANVEAEDGSADFDDTLVNNGTFEYRAFGLRGTVEGEPSTVLVVVAA